MRPVIHLVGAGPGDPELLTVKAQRLIREADVVVYDRLVGDGVLELIPTGATRIYVGKAAGAHHMRQDEINDLLASLARPGRLVVRLKGGDPLIFGRGSEEALYLARHGIRVEFVPGITAASGCCAALGIPLTHRGHATGVQFVTGHCRADAELDLDWDALADPETTLVIYMGLANLSQFTERLIAAGRPPCTPAIAIERGTTPEQRVCRASLLELRPSVLEAELEAPVLIVVGSVVGVMDELAPFGLHDLGASNAQQA